MDDTHASPSCRRGRRADERLKDPWLANVRGGELEEETGAGRWARAMDRKRTAPSFALEPPCEGLSVSSSATWRCPPYPVTAPAPCTAALSSHSSSRSSTPQAWPRNIILTHPQHNVYSAQYPTISSLHDTAPPECTDVHLPHSDARSELATSRPYGTHHNDATRIRLTFTANDTLFIQHGYPDRSTLTSINLFVVTVKHPAQPRSS